MPFGQVQGKITQELIDELKVLWLPELDRRFAGRPGAGRSATTGNALSGTFTAANCPLTILQTAGGAPVQLTVTPPFDCWWPMFASSLFGMSTAAWFRAVLDVLLQPNDVDGAAYNAISDDVMHNVGAADLAGATIAGQFKLAANVTYTATLRVSGVTGGTWAYYRQEDRTYLHSPGIVPR